MFPHESALIVLKENGAEVLKTEGNHDLLKDATGDRVRNVNAKLGSVIFNVPPDMKPRWTILYDEEDEFPNTIPNNY